MKKGKVRLGLVSTRIHKMAEGFLETKIFRSAHTESPSVSIDGTLVGLQLY